MKKNVYLDNNATTKVAPEVIEAMMPFFQDFWGNPSSMHTFGGQVKKYVDKAREQVAALLGAHPSEVVFTSCGSESDNTAIRGTVEVIGKAANIITTRVEHPAVIGTCRFFKSIGYKEIELGVDSQGDLNLDELKAHVNSHSVVSIMWANNETGVIFPIDKIAQIVKNAGGVFHTDAVQVVGKVPTDMGKTPVDMLALSGHKLHAPKGIGALYVRKGTKVNPLILGGHQEQGKRAGTENVPYIVGLGVACELAMKHQEEEKTRVAMLRDKLEKGIMALNLCTRVNGNRESRLPNTTNISFEKVEGEAILLMFDDLGIAASSGSACTSGSLEPSAVMRAMGVPYEAAHGSIRFSLSRYNTEEEIDYVLANVEKVIRRLHEISPFVEKK